MTSRNTPRSYGRVSRLFHWMTALLILVAFPLGLIANQLPYDTAEALTQKAQLFSVHKTIGLLAFFVALGRILWTLTETHPAPLHPERRLEVFLAGLVHWMLYISLVAVPLTGWVHHAAVTGFAPILWPFGQTLPFVPQSEFVAELAGGLHWIFTKLLAASILLHVAGAFKHHLVDRDSTLRRMTRGEVAPDGAVIARRSLTPILAAVLLFAAATGLTLATTTAPQAVAATDAPATETPTTGNWQVTTGTLAFGVRQMGADVQGQFAQWTADITFAEQPTDGKHGTVTVQIDTGSLTLGSVSDQAKSKDFFDVAQFPTATFTADLLPAAQGYQAAGTLTLRGATVPVTLPFTLQITGDTAQMQGQVTLDRRDFGMGQSYGDESSVGFGVTVDIALTATQGN